MPFQIIRSDITKVSADVIVNTANPQPKIGRGTDSAIYSAAGADALLAARREIGGIEPGQAAATPAFALPAKYIIHTIGPVWTDGCSGERDILYACYENTLALAENLKADSIAFPLIATGVYGFPKDEALNIALSAIGKFLLTHEMNVILVVFGSRTFELSSQIVGAIDEYIDEHQEHELLKSEYGGWEAADFERWRRNANRVHSAAVPQTLDQLLDDAGDTFQQRLFKLIDASGMDDVTVYKKANIDRKVFSSIRCKKDYKPSKKTAVAFSVALKLPMQDMLELLSCASMTLSKSDKFDLIITYCVQNGIYDIFAINAILFQYGQPLLGV